MIGFTVMKIDLGKLLVGLNALVVGAFFAALQWCSFCLLQSYLASTAIVYMMTTVAWLFGGLLGLLIPSPALEVAWFMTATMAYYALLYLTLAHLYDYSYLAPQLIIVMVMGGYAGRFFKTRSARFQSVKWLFFLENTGFLVGTIGSALALFFYGYDALILTPVSIGICVLLTIPRIDNAKS